ncbi:orotate phosphoribosyltransferase [Sulfuriferula sp.]|uniref:orotate phosphoribosyltransferase n=1 Tax=Sulfuriferula sp. TaxID=2025307 RepID=UPI000EDC7E5F|nr:orotate phosphoribosyltransferase [Sulfuriferula sp.]MDP2024944.1 orotate phosphoribosyltransferase [Sulfuriferula sp.]HAN56532.1 orotate phosphoribosyltransferase [Betaproteobacteria bacterium]
MSDFRQQFLSFAIEQKVLCFGEFKTKAGRMSPYFFNAGLFADGVALQKLGEFYAKAIIAADIQFDVLFGPAYKGIPLAAATVVALAAQGQKVPYSFNRKETKDHGEGGNIVGAPLKGRVLIIDDVISAGTSVRESVELIRSQGATPAGVVIALDRMERGQGELSAVQEVQMQYAIPVFAIANLDDLVAYLQTHENMEQNLREVAGYRVAYGVS